jgi:ubiquinone biosynthesis monooxygenase Coq7
MKNRPKNRQFSFLDRCLTEIDHALRTVTTKPRPGRPTPGACDERNVHTAESRLTANLMRVNHSGEIAAQALYRGQALVAQDEKLRTELLQSAGEEHDHLAWCLERTKELGGGSSLFVPVWYAGSFIIGVAAGLSGDQRSLGFLAETEKQVAEHLDSHLNQVPLDDTRSRAILKQMREDEVKHGHKAMEMGGRTPPPPVRTAMRALSKVMTSTSFRI